MKKEKQRQPWDQQCGESDAAYVRFLMYRNLGPGRSIDAAYRALDAATKRSKTQQKNQRANGTWTQDCSEWNWQARAEAWDLHILIQAGQRIVTKFFAALERLAAKVLEALGEENFKPGSWSELLESFEVLSGHVHPEAVRRVATGGGSEESPAQRINR